MNCRFVESSYYRPRYALGLRVYKYFDWGVKYLNFNLKIDLPNDFIKAIWNVFILGPRSVTIERQSSFRINREILLNIVEGTFSLIT